MKDQSSDKSTAQSANPNEPNYVMLPDVYTKGMDRNWLELWEQVAIWYGDIKKKETGEQFLKRLQATYNLSKSPEPSFKEKPDFFTLAEATHNEEHFELSINELKVIGMEKIWNDYVIPLQKEIEELRKGIAKESVP